MINIPEVILYTSLVLIAVYYFSKAEHTFIKWAIFCFILNPLPKLIKSFVELDYPLGIVSVLALLAALLLVGIHLNKSNLEKRDVLLISVFLLPFFLNALSALIFRPLAIIGALFVPLNIGIFVYYTFKYKDSDYLTDEMRIMNLFFIQLLIGIVRLAGKFL